MVREPSLVARAGRTAVKSAGDLIPCMPAPWTAGEGCSRARASISAAIDKEADPDELAAATSHLADCERCRRFVAEINTVTRVLRSSGERSARTPGSVRYA